MQAGLWEKGCCCLRGRRPITRSEWYCCLLPLQLPASLLAPQYCTKNTLKKRKPLEKPEKHGLQPSKAVFWIQWDRVSLFGEGRKLLSARSPVVIKLIGVRPWVEAFALGLVSLSRKEDKPLGNPFWTPCCKAAPSLHTPTNSFSAPARICFSPGVNNTIVPFYPYYS